MSDSSLSYLEVEEDRATAIIKHGPHKVRVILTWSREMNRPSPFTLTRLLFHKGEKEILRREALFKRIETTSVSEW